MTYDKIILGAGLYGLYAAQKCGAAGQRVLVLDKGKMVYLDTPERVFAHGRELRQMGLSLPEASRLSMCLREKGLQVPEGLYTMDRMEKWLLEVLP